MTVDNLSRDAGAARGDSGREIAAREQAEAALRESEARYRALATVAPVGIFHTDAQGLVTYVNEKWCEIGGMTAEEAMGTGWIAGLHPEDRAHIAAKWNAFAKNQTTYRAECRYQRPDGVTAYCYVQALPETDADGNLTGYIGCVTDTTEHERAEEALRESEARFRDFSNASSDWFWEMDENLRFSYFSDRFTEITGVPQETLLGKTREESGIPLVASEEWEAHLANLEAHRPFRGFQHPRARADGRVVHLSINGRPVFDGVGNFKGYRGTGSDVTERKLAEEALQRAHDELERRVEARTAELLDANTQLVQEVAERTRTEEALRRSEAQLSAAQRVGHFGHWSLDIATGDVTWSDEACRIFGFEPGQYSFTFDHFLTRVHGDDLDLIDQADKQLMATGGSRHVEYRVIPPDGGVRTIEERGEVRYDDAGKAIYMHGVIQDITERKQVEDALRESERGLANAQRLSHIGNWDLDPATELMRWSDELYRILGVTPDGIDASSEAYIDLIHPDDKAMVEELEAALYGAHEPYSVDYRIIRPDGGIRHIHTEADVAFDDAGKAVRIGGSDQDITERKQAEEALRESEDRYARAAAGANDGIWDWDVRTGADYFSPRWLEILGYGEGEVAPHVDSFAELTRPDDRERVWSEVRAHLDERVSYDTEFRMRHKAGHYVWIRARGQAVWDDAGEPLRMAGSISDITDQKQAEEALRESEKRYREVFEDSPVGIWESDWSGVRRMIDDLAKRGVTDWRGYFEDNPEQLSKAYDLIELSDVSRAILRLYDVPDVATLAEMYRSGNVPQDNLDGVREAIVGFMAGRWESEYEAREQRSDGTAIVTRNRLAISPSHQDDWSRVVYAVEDITERKAADQRFRELLESTPDAMVIANASGEIVLVNNQAEVLFGYPREELVGQRVETLMPEAFRRHHRKHRRTFAADPRARAMGQAAELRALARDGRVFPVEVSLSPIKTGDGMLVAAAVRDISERRRAEEAIRTRDAWLRGILENTPIQIVLKDTEGRIMAISQSAADEVGLPRDDFIGRTTADFLPADIAETYMAADREVVETGRLVQREVAEEHDGKTRHYLNAKFPLKDDAGRTIGICSLTNDVTDSKAIQAQLFQAQKMEAVGQLTGGIAHDFNNLLAIIMGNLELVADELVADGDLSELLGVAVVATEDAATLTQRLLAFSRNQPLAPSVGDANALVRKMVSLVRHTLDESIGLKAVLAKGAVPVYVDSGQLESALLNLVVNARDAMPRGGAITISTDSLRLDEASAEAMPGLALGDYVVVGVSDTGSGMAPEVIERAFEPFFTTKGIGEGSGLGLSMVFGFVKQSGGHVTIDSEVGHGTTVKLYLPAAQEAAEHEAPAAATPWRAAAGETILVVEDDERVRRLAVTILRGLGYAVLEAGDADAALAIIERTPGIELLFTDIVLPGKLNGVELAREARRRRPALAVIYASAYPASALLDQGRLESGADLIEKPYHKDDLAARLAAALDPQSTPQSIVERIDG